MLCVTLDVYLNIYRYIVLLELKMHGELHVCFQTSLSGVASTSRHILNYMAGHWSWHPSDEA